MITKQDIEKSIRDVFYSRQQSSSRRVKLYGFGEASLRQFHQAMKEEAIKQGITYFENDNKTEEPNEDGIFK